MRVIFCVRCDRYKEGYASRGMMTNRWCKTCIQRYQRKAYRRRKLLVLKHYGGSPPHCACCGEWHIVFLAIDHINGGGKAQSRFNKGGKIIDWIVRNKFPEGFQILCMNCNWAKHVTKTCPHQKI